MLPSMPLLRLHALKQLAPLLGVLVAACGGQSVTRQSDEELAGAKPSGAEPSGDEAEQAPNFGGGSAGAAGSGGATQVPGGSGGITAIANDPPVGEGGAASSAGDPGAMGPDEGGGAAATDPDNDASAVLALSGPRAEYSFASFVVNEDGGWVLEEAVETDAVELEVRTSTLAAGALADSGGGLVDVGIAGCDVISADPVVRRVPADYPTIQAAIDATEPGDTVLVAAGVYTEQLRLRSHVKLIGAGASVTVLDGGNEAANLIDFTGARSTVVSGFTLRNVAGDAGCSAEDPRGCSGDWYRAAVYGDGHESESEPEPACGAVSSLLFTRNIVTGNDIGMLLYFQARAVVTNNLFVANRHAFIANHHQDHSLVANNVFYANDQYAIAADASYLSVLNNAFVENGTAFAQQYIQRGFVGCNLTFGNADLGEGFADGGFVDLDPLFVAPSEDAFQLDDESPARGLGCMGEDHELTTDVGAYGGPLGGWSP
jgi:hypothetical protein